MTKFSAKLITVRLAGRNKDATQCTTADASLHPATLAGHSNSVLMPLRL